MKFGLGLLGQSSCTASVSEKRGARFWSVECEVEGEGLGEVRAAGSLVPTGMSRSSFLSQVQSYKTMKMNVLGSQN